MLLDEMGTSPKYEIDDFTTKTAYNIDLFQGDGEEKKVKIGKSGGDVEMKEDKKQSKKHKGERKSSAGKEGSDDDEESGSSSSDSNSSSSDSQKNVEAPAQHIEVPASVIQRFFSKKESLTNYLTNVNQETTFAMLDDLCLTYKYED